jgi:hypothetical protein
VLSSLMVAAGEHDLWDVLLPMLDLLEPEARERVAAQLPAA